MSSNPKYIGPGYWASWHLKALQATDKTRKEEVARSIVIDISNFPCKNCREDSIEYIKKYPILPAVNSNEPLSVFKWTVNFHNYVNLKLNKSVLNWREAKEAWEGESMCFENCGVSEEDIKKEDDNEEEELIDEEQDFVIRGY